MNNTINIQLNYFGPYIARDEVGRSMGAKPEPGGILGHPAYMLASFFNLQFESLSKEVLERYADVTPDELHLPIVPHSKEILERLLIPLKSAKKNYCLGDYSATIALCGIVGEMLAMLLWKINETKINNTAMNEDQEKALFGSTFEKLGQERRLDVLKVYGMVDDSKFIMLKEIKNGRRPYLHLWSTSLKREDALHLFKNAFSLFKEITGIGIATAGEVKINPLLLKLFKK
jgi:hypothetical protein